MAWRGTNNPEPVAVDRSLFLIYTGVQLFITLTLLGYSWAVPDDPSIRSLVLGAVITHWLQQSVRMGQQVGAAPPKGTTVTQVTTSERPADG